MHDGHGVLHALLCTFYYQESVETIKNGRARRFVIFTMNHPPALLSTGGSPSMWRLCRMDRKGKCFFSCPYATNPIQSFLGTVVATRREWDCCFASPPLRALSRFWCPGLIYLFENHNSKARTITLLTGNLIQFLDALPHPSVLSPKYERIWWLGSTGTVLS